MEILIALIIAVIGLLAVLKLFSGTPPAPKHHHKAQQQQQQPKKAAKSQSPKGDGANKKESKAERKEREEEDAFVERELKGQQGKGLSKEKFHVISLEEKKAKALAASGSPLLQQGAQPPEFSEREKLIEKEKGFQIVEKKKKEAVKPVVDTVSRQEELDRKLNGFFRNSDRRSKKREDNGGSPTAGADKNAEKEESPKANVRIFENKDTFNSNSAQRGWNA